MNPRPNIPTLTEREKINHPAHYNESQATCDKCGNRIECITVVNSLDFVIGNIIKYAWRAGSKEGTTKLQDLEKMLWYANYAVERERKNASG